MIPVLPETAPFSPEQRAWLNGFFSGVFGLAGQQPPALSADLAAGTIPSLISPAFSGTTESGPEADEPWHDMTLELPDRMKLAENRPLSQKLMAAMAQQDCGQCGYLCQTYSAALATGAEKDPNRCVPGGKPTSRMLKTLLAEAKEKGEGQEGSGGIQLVAEKGLVPSDPFHRDQPFPARLNESCPLTAQEAEKATQSVVISLEGSGLAYQPGDSLGVFAENDPDLVHNVLKVFHADGLEAVSLSDGVILSSKEALSRRCDLTIPSDEVLELLARHAEDEDQAKGLLRLASGETDCEDEGIWDLCDLLTKYSTARPHLDDFVPTLGKLQPRLYSIASSPLAHPGEVHLCVSVVKYHAGGRPRRGVASTYLSERMKLGSRVGVYLQRSHEFRLPKNPDTPVVMVGPGTGVAPFRAFLENRKAEGATGKNWLFFGAQKESTDFLYKEQLKEYLKDGTLARLSTAFSRDQTEKVYVQNRMLEQKEELWRWINDEKAHFYVCGDGKKMAADVENTLVKVACDQGGLSQETAAAYVRRLAEEGRFLKDVY